MADAATRRMTIFGVGGQVAREIMPRLPVFPHDLCVLPDGTILVVGPGQMNGLLSRVAPDGRIIPYPPLPDPALAALSLDNRGGAFAAVRGGCFLGLQFDRRFFVLTPAGVALQGLSVEPYAIEDTAKRARGRHPRIGLTLAALAVAADDQSLDIAFDGLSEVSGRVIDRYDPKTGRYRGSVVAPQPPVNRIVWLARAGETFVMIHGINGFPAVSAFQLEPGPTTR